MGSLSDTFLERLYSICLVCVLYVDYFLQGINLVWESYKLDTYVQRLAEAIFNFQEKMDDLVAMEEEIEVEVQN